MLEELDVRDSCDAAARISHGRLSQTYHTVKFPLLNMKLIYKGDSALNPPEVNRTVFTPVVAPQ